MTGITDPTEEYFKDGLWGWVTSAWVKLVATAGGLLKIQIGGQDADVEVKQTTPADLTPGICGWDGTAWRKLPLLFGYTSHWFEANENLNAATGTNNLLSTVVPAGEVRVLTNVESYNTVTATSKCYLYITNGTTEAAVYRTAYITLTRWLWWSGWIVVPAGWRVLVRFTGCVAGDTIRCGISGHKQAIS